MSEYPTHDPADPADPADYFDAPLAHLRSRGAHPDLVPASRAEQAERLRHLAELVETHEDAFDMRDWYRIGIDYDTGEVDLETAQAIGGCGTAACLGGWTVIDLIRREVVPSSIHSVRVAEVAGAWLGFSMDEAGDLFYGHWHPGCPRTREEHEARQVSWFWRESDPDPDPYDDDDLDAEEPPPRVDVIIGDITAAEAVAFIRRLAEHAELMAELERGVAAIVETGVTAEDAMNAIAIGAAALAAVMEESFDGSLV